MPRTRSEHLQDLQYVLRTILLFPDNGEVEKALVDTGYTTQPDVLAASNDDLEDLSIATPDDTTRKLQKPEKGKLQAFQSYVIWRGINGKPILEDEWQTLDGAEYDHYRISPDFISLCMGLKPSITPSGTSAHPSGPNLVNEFRRGIKRDMTLFLTLKDDKAWDGWRRATVAQARAQIVEEILDHNYAPSTKDEQALFDEKQKYMYAVFERTLLTDIGKSIVCKYAEKGDAQNVFHELSEYYEKSTKAAMYSGELLTYITSAKFNDGTWKGTAHGFILHWQDQVRKYESLTPRGDWFCDNAKCTMLQNAIHSVAELRAVKNQADQTRTTTGRTLTYSEYCSLLVSAASQFDREHCHSAPRPRRTIYQHDIDLPTNYGEFLDNGEYYTATTDTDEAPYNIDSDVNVVEAFQSCTTASAPSRPCLPYDKWTRLTPDAQRAWDQLPDDAKHIILAPTLAPGACQNPSTPQPSG